MTKNVVIIAHNIRSTHNVGSIIRTCEGFGVKTFFVSGYTPYPKVKGDIRLPHIAEKLDKQIHKSALGAEKLVEIKPVKDLEELINVLKADGYKLIALEQHTQSTKLPNFDAPEKVAILLGEEVHGTSDQLLKICDEIVEIPMLGQKESFNVSVAAGIILYHVSLL